MQTTLGTAHDSHFFNISRIEISESGISTNESEFFPCLMICCALEFSLEQQKYNHFHFVTLNPQERHGLSDISHSRGSPGATSLDPLHYAFKSNGPGTSMMLVRIF